MANDSERVKCHNENNYQFKFNKVWRKTISDFLRWYLCLNGHSRCDKLSRSTYKRIVIRVVMNSLNTLRYVLFKKKKKTTYRKHRRPTVFFHVQLLLFCSLSFLFFLINITLWYLALLTITSEDIFTNGVWIPKIKINLLIRFYRSAVLCYLLKEKKTCRIRTERK